MAAKSGGGQGGLKSGGGQQWLNNHYGKSGGAPTMQYWLLRY